MISQSNLIKQLNDLYFIQRKHYLVQYKEPVGYRQYILGQIINNKKVKQLMDWQFEKHLQGEFTIGTFSKQFSKFLTFDVDFHDKEMAKWMTYKVAVTLNELGIYDFYISYSGNKGYHIDMFFEDLIHIQHAEKFYNYVLDNSNVRTHFDEANKIEFRPTDKLGVKVPIGIHQKSGNFCGFCVIDNGLEVMSKKQSYEYLFTIKKIKRQMILDIINESIEPVEKIKVIKTEEAISPHRPLSNYEQSEDSVIEHAQDLLMNGLKSQGSRNNAIFEIGLYLKYCGLDLEQCRAELYTWMEWQNPNLYILHH